MNYLCMTVQKKVVEERRFGSREMAEDFFWQRFGEFLKEKLKEERRKLENRIRYYERRAQKYRESLEIAEIYDMKKKEAKEELEQINRQLNDEKGEYKNCCYVEKYDISKQPVFGEAELVLHLAGIFHMGNTYRVTEEKYYCMKLKSTGKKGILEVRKAIPEAMAADSISLDICQESLEAAARLNQNIKKMVSKTKKEFISRTECRKR